VRGHRAEDEPEDKVRHKATYHLRAHSQQGINMAIIGMKKWSSVG